MPRWRSASSSLRLPACRAVVRIVVGIFGVGGSKERGLELLREAAAHGVVTNVDSRTVLSLYLRHEGRYAEAIEVQHGLATSIPTTISFGWK